MLYARRCPPAAAAVALRDRVRGEVAKVWIGAEDTVTLLLASMLARGHVLLEGVPGLAKTTLAKAMATAVGAQFRRIQFTPDLLPADITGTYVFNQKLHEFELRRGPIFAQVVLADEINRAPAKTQSALLEAMQERQVTIGDETFRLPEPLKASSTLAGSTFFGEPPAFSTFALRMWLKSSFCSTKGAFTSDQVTLS